jgi:gliding motility-associated-like protein
MKQALLSVLGLLLCAVLHGQTGTEFWVAPPDVTYLHNSPGDEPIFFNVTAGNTAAVVTIEQPARPSFNGGTPIVLNVPANSSVRYNMTSLKAQLETRPTNTVCQTGLHITSTANITCYYESSNSNNPDIIALKGTNGLGTEFYIPLHKHTPFRNHDFGNNANMAFASFDIVATENNTLVLINSPVNVDGHPTGSPFTVLLQRGETYSCANTLYANHTDPTTHPSGAAVIANKPIAISIKDDSNHNPSGGCYDLMSDQIVPVNILGTDYVAVKGSLYATGDESVFLMAVENNTKIYLDGNPTPVATLFAGQYYRHDMDYLSGATDNATYMSASKPVYAIHVTGFGCEMGMAILPPLNCAGSQQVGITRSTSEGFFLNLLVRTGSENDFVVTGPGTATIPGSAFVTVPGTGGEWMAAHIQYNTTQVPVNQGLVVTNTSDVFSLGVINGGAGSGCRYGFFSEFSGRIDVNAGIDQTLCAGVSASLTGTVSGGSTTGIWTTTGSGTFQPSATSLNATYEPSIGDIALGGVTLRLTSTGPCTPEFDEMTLTLQPKPITDAGPDQQVCTSAPTVSLAGGVLNAVGGVWTGGTNPFLPSSSNLNATYTPTAAEVASGSLWIHLTSTGNGVCSAVKDSMLVTFTPAPTVNAGPDQTLCANNPVASLNGAITVATGGIWSGGAGTFDPSTTNLHATYTPTAAEIANGSVTLTLTTTGNGNCVVVSDQVQLSFTAAPTANAGANSSVCANNADIALNGSVTVATGGIWSGGTGSYSPNNSALNATYTPTATEIANGSVTLILTTTGNGNCLATTSSRTISFTPAPIVDAGTNGTVCANNAAISLNGSVTGATGGTWSGGGGTYSPNNNTLNATYTPTAAERAAGTVTLTLTSTGNANCNAVSDQVTFSITPAPTANAGVDQTLCSNNPVAALNGSFTIATGGVWSGGNGSFDPSTTNMGATYTPTPAEIANGSVTLTLTTTGNGSCVQVSDNITLNFTPSPVVNAGVDVTRCANNAQVALNGSVTVATGGVWSGGLGSFNPNNSTLNATYTPTAAEIAAGTLTLTLTSTGNGTCNAVSDSRLITFTPAPTVDAGANGTVCANNAAISLNGAVTIATGAIWSGGTGTYSPNNSTLNATYTPSAAERAAGTVTLTLTTIGNGSCNAVSDQVTFSITPAPTVTAGADQTLCGNNANTTLNGGYTVATGIIWSGGAGTFTPGNTAVNPVYTPTATEIANGSVTLTATTTGVGSCSAVSDAMTITFTPSPTANAGADISLCANNASVALNGSITLATGGMWSGGAGTYAPNNTVLNATYTPTAAELAGGILTLTLTTTGNGTCNAATDSRTITFTPAPTVDAGANGTVCANASTITLNGSVVGASGGLWSGGAGSFSPNNTTLNATYTPTAAERAAGTVTLTLTSTGNANCNAMSDQVTFIISPAPTANAGADQMLCSNNPVATLSGGYTVATGGVWSGGAGSFFPSTINMNATYTPTAAEIANGNVTLTLTTTGNGLCNAVSDNIILNFTPSPTVNAGADASVCMNNPAVALNGGVTIASGGIWSGGAGSFTPNNTALNATYTPTPAELAAGTLTLTLTTTGNGNCVAVSDSRLITFTPAPIVNAGTPASVCANAPLMSLNGSVSGATGAIWSAGAGTFSPNNTALNATYTPTAAEIANGSVTFTLTSAGNGNCSAVTSQVTYAITPAPTANAGANITRCANNPAAALNGSVTVATGGIWSGGNGTFAPGNTNLGAVYTPSAAEIANGNVTLTLTTTGNGLCAAVTDDVLLTFTPAPTVNAGADVSVCANNATVVLNGTVGGATGGVWSGGNGSFTPNNTALNATYTPTPAEIANGILTLTLSTTGNGDCNAVSDERVITFTPGPTVHAGVNGTVCANNSAITLAGSVIGATGGVWSGGAGSFVPNNATLNATYNPTAAERAAGTVTLTLTSTGNGNCNAVSSTVTYTITPAPTVNASPAQSLCSNNPVATLNGSYTVATGAIWSGGAGTFSPSATNMNATYTPTAAEVANGNVTLTLTTTGNGLCNAMSSNITLSFTPAPTVNAGAPASFCANNAAIPLNGTVTIASGGIWSGGLGSFTPNNTTLNATYTPTPAEIAAGTLTLTLTSTGNNNCTAVSSSRTITFTPAPTVDAGANGTVCANNASIGLNGSITVATGAIWSGGTGTFTPNNTTLNATYMPSAAERAAGTVTLTLTTVGNGNCSPVSDQVTFTITPAPTANAGADRVLCANNAVTSLAGAFTVATGGVWSGGNGTFDPSITNMSAIYTPTAAEITAGSVTLTLATTGNGSCNAVNDQVLLTFTDAPTANAGPDVTVCANNAAVALGGSVVTATGGVWSGGTGSFSPNANTLSATYTPGAADIAAGQITLTLTTTGNGNCAPATDTRIITYTPAPIVNAGADGVVCANAALINLNGSVNGAVGGVWSGGAGVFSPNNITLNATYMPTVAEIANGSVTLTLTSAGNGLCNPVTDQVTFVITPAPTVNAGADQTLCGNNANAVLNAAITVATGVQWSGGTGLYAPGSTAQNITYMPSPIEIANGSVTLIVTTTGNGNCGAVSDQVTLNFTPAPMANAGPDQTVSSNNANTTLAGSFNIATGIVWSGGAGTYNPNNTTTNAVYTPTAAEIAAGSVTLTMTTTGNGACAPSSDQMTITFGAAPTANAGPDQTICANNASVVLDGDVTIATGGIWSGGTGTYTPNSGVLNATYVPSAAEIAAGSVMLTLTTVGNGNSNPVTDQMTITITPAPVVNAGANLTVCANQSTAQLAGIVNHATGGVWSGGSGTFNPSNTNLNATYTPTPGEIAAGTVTLTLTSTGNGLCNTVSDQMTINIAPAPVVNAGLDATVCSNNAAVQLAATVSNAGGGIWSGGTGEFSPSITALNAVYTPSTTELNNGSVTLNLTSTGNGSCAQVTDQVFIVFTQTPVVNAGADVTVCANGATVNLNGSVTVAGGGVWSGGSGTFSPNANALNATYTPSPAEVALGTVTLTLTSTQNGLCNPVSDQMTITIIAAPVADAGSDLFVCSNNANVQLGGSVAGAGGGQWSGGAGSFTPSIASLNAVYTPTPAEIAAGTLTLTLTTIGNGNCTPVSDNVLITFTAAPTAEAGSGGVFCANNANIQLNGSVTVANGGAWSGAQGTFSPNANSLNAVYTPSVGELAAGSVTLTLSTTGNNGCTSVSDQVTYTFTPAPTANAGVDLNSCANNATVQLNGAVTIATGGLWTGGTGGFVPNNATLNATYTPSAAEIAAGSATLTLTTVGNGLCNAVNDQVVITIAPSPIVDAGAPIAVCANNANAQLNGSVLNASGEVWSGAGTFSPSNTNLNAIYTPTAAEVASGVAIVTLTSTGMGLCNAVSDNVTITFTPAPVVDAGASQTLCANNANVQLAGSVSGATGGAWSGGAGTFAPNANTLNAVYTPSTAEITASSLWLYLTTTGNGGCNSARDSVQVFFTPAPNANAGADAHVCANDAVVDLNGAVTVATGGVWSGGSGSFSPNNTVLNATYTPSLGEIAAGQATLTLTTTGIGNCTAVQDIMVITIDPVPVVNAGPDQSICANNPTLQLNGFVGNAPGAIWSGGMGNYVSGATATATQYIPTADEIAAGSITFTLTSTGTTICNAMSDQVTITFTGAPVVDAGADLAICANNSAVQLNGNVTNANGGVWSGGNGTYAPANNVFAPVYTPTAAEIASGSVTLTLTSTGNGNCYAVNDQVQITFTPAPVANAGTDLNVCANNPVVDLNGSMTVATGGVWSGGLGSYAPDANALNAQYTLTPFELQQGSVTLTLSSTGNGNCLAVNDQVTITVTPAPVVNAGADITACSNALQVALNGTVSGGATTGAWTTSGTGTFFPSADLLNATYMASSLDSLNGSVTLSLTSTGNGLCNAVSDVLTLTILPNAIANAGVDRTVCASESTIALNGSISGNATQGTWTTTGAGTFSPNADATNAVYQFAPGDAGTLTFTWSVNSCDNAMDQMTVTIVPESQANAGADQVTCVSDLSIVINGIVSGASTTGVWSTTGTGTFTNPATALANIYNASTADSLATGVDLILTATGTSVCPAAMDTMHISILPFGTVNAGADLSYCANNAVVQLNGSLVGDATQTQWSTSGTGSFYPSNSVLTPTYIPSAIDTAIGNVTLTLTALNSCNNASDVMQLELTPAPYVNAGADQTFCDQVSQFNLSGMISGITNVGQWSTTGTGSTANAGSLNTTYTASAADVAAGQIVITLSSLNNGNCNTVTDAMTIYLTDAVQANAGPDQSVCVSSTYAQLQGQIVNGSPSGLWSATGSGSFVPGPDVLNAQYHFSAADVANGSVVLTLLSTNTGTCPPAQDNIVLTFGNASHAYAGADQTLCANAPIAQLNGNFSGGAQGAVWSSSGSGFFSNTADPHAIYTMSAADLAAGSVQLTLTTITDGTCAVASDAVVLNVQALPTIIAGSDVVACTAAPVQLFGQAVNATGGIWQTSGTGTFLDANALATLYYPSAADSTLGSVTLTVTTTGVQPCSAVSDQMVITFGGGLAAMAGADVTACSTDAEVALMGTVQGTTTGQWSTTGTGSFVPSATSLNATYVPGPADFVIGNVSLILSTTNNQGCAAGRDTLVVTYHVPPVVDAGAGVLLCNGLEDVQLNANVQHAAALQWFTTGTGSFSPADDVANAVYTPSVADSIAGGVHLIVTGYGMGACGNTSDSLFIDIGPTRVANAGADLAVCADGAYWQLGGTVTGVNGGVWTTTGTGTFLPDASTLDATYVPSPTDLVFGQLAFVLTTRGNMGCPAGTDTMAVSLQQPPTASAGPDINVCDASAEVQLGGSFNGATGVLWSSNGSGVFLPSNTDPNAAYHPGATDEQLGTVRMILTTTGNGLCAAASDTLFLSFTNPLQPAFGITNACAGGQTVFLDASTTTGSPIIGWNWSLDNGATANGPQVSTSFAAPGEYTATLTVFAQNGCSATTTRTFEVLGAPVAGFTISGELFTETPIAFADTSVGATNWQYDFGDGNGALSAEPTHAYELPGQYIIVQTVTNANGCMDRDSLLITIEMKDILPPKLPNAFSPNGDGVNDVFYVRGGPFETMELRIYNGWGEMIFETTDPTAGWDGTYNGKPEINGVYVYSVVATTTTGETHDRSGKVTLTR